MQHGEPADADDTVGQGFDGPTGIEIAAVNGRAPLYVGDVGNQRIVKYCIVW